MNARHHHDDGDQRADHAEADAPPAGLDRAVATGPFAAFPLAGVLRAGGGRGGGAAAAYDGVSVAAPEPGLGGLGFAVARLQIVGYPAVLRLGVIRLVLVVVLVVVVGVVFGFLILRLR